MNTPTPEIDVGEECPLTEATLIDCGAASVVTAGSVGFQYEEEASPYNEQY